MKILVYIYIILYFLYIILGPHFIRRLLKNDQLLISDDLSSLYKRCIYLSYITLLYNAYYFYNPSLESFYNALLINTVSIIGYIIKWNYLKYLDPYYFSGIISHVLFFIPILLSPFYLNISNTFNIGIQSQFTIILLLFYGFIINIIYKN